MWEITINYNSNHKKHKYELVEEPKKQVNRIFIHEKLAIKVIMDCRITSAHKCRTRSGFTTWCHFNKGTISANKNNKFIWSAIQNFKL